MGEAKHRQHSQQALLAVHKRCVYCGAQAATVDHCPPRCFFLRRVWPETFDYPACGKCNAAARLDEQALAVMVRARASQPRYSVEARTEFRRLFEGVFNNQPDIVKEWMSESASSRKRSFRRLFGQEEGDRFRNAGWGLMHMGQLTEALIQRFMVRLGQSMYYNHVGKLFHGTLYTRHASLLQIGDAESFITTAISIAPAVGISSRSGKPLDDQFTYRFNVSPDHETFYAVVQFSEQFVFLITAMGPEMAARFADREWPAEAVGRRTQIRLASD